MIPQTAWREIRESTAITTKRIEKLAHWTIPKLRKPPLEVRIDNRRSSRRRYQCEFGSRTDTFVFEVPVSVRRSTGGACGDGSDEERVN